MSCDSAGHVDQGCSGIVESAVIPVQGILQQATPTSRVKFPDALPDHTTITIQHMDFLCHR